MHWKISGCPSNSAKSRGTSQNGGHGSGDCYGVAGEQAGQKQNGEKSSNDHFYSKTCSRGTEQMNFTSQLLMSLLVLPSWGQFDESVSAEIYGSNESL
jgi:hypothetical protein